MSGGPLLSLHVVAGALALVLGAVALLARKGGSVHRRGGMLFVLAMVLMGVTASLLGNGYGGVMPVYFVGTALLAVRPETTATRRLHVAALLFATGFALVLVLGGVEAFRAPGRALDGVPFAMHFFLAAVMGLAASGDARVLRRGLPRGRPRLRRHLWRMCFALFIAAGSFFSIRERVAKVLPQPFTSTPMRMLPIALVFVAMFWWLWRLRGGGERAGQVRGA